MTFARFVAAEEDLPLPTGPTLFAMPMASRPKPAQEAAWRRLRGALDA